MHYVIAHCLVCYCECGSRSAPVTAVSWMLSVSAQALHAALYRSIYILLIWYTLGKLQGFLGAFAKLRRATINFVMSDCPSFRTEQLGSHWTDFHEFWDLTNLRNLSNVFIAWCIPKAKSTHSEYAILIAFPLQQLLHERASMLRYTCIACVVVSCI